MTTESKHPSSNLPGIDVTQEKLLLIRVISINPIDGYQLL